MTAGHRPRARRIAAATAVLVLSACASTPVSLQPGFDGWQSVAIPGKRATEYTWELFDGRSAMAARSEASASMMRLRVNVASAALRNVSFSWQVTELMPGAHVGQTDTEDAPARLLLAFGGDVASLPARTRMMFELAQALSGEAPPYATLMYVWDAQAPVDTVIVNPRTDRIRKIVVDSGPTELRRWREHRRDVAADFRRAFGEEPGPLMAIAVMTDSDNTRSRSRAWYGPVTLD
jgi:Protein of unknown function (DUF3047)